MRGAASFGVAAITRGSAVALVITSALRAGRQMLKRCIRLARLTAGVMKRQLDTTVDAEATLGFDAGEALSSLPFGGVPLGHHSDHW